MVRLLLLINVVVYLLQYTGPGEWIVHFALWPSGEPAMLRTDEGWVQVPPFHIWQLVTYGFLHANFSHLFLNLFALWMFGTAVERYWGSARFAVYYFVCLVGAALVQLVAMYLHLRAGGAPFPTLGASGAVFGLLLAFGMMFPNERMVSSPPIPLKAKWFVLGYGGLELFFGVAGIASEYCTLRALGRDAVWFYP